MKSGFILIVAFFTINKVAFCQKSDSIFLYNGQVLVGTIKYAQLGVLTIDDIDLKMVSVKMYKIKRVNAEKTIFKIETSNKKIIYSSLYSSEKNGFIRLDTANDSHEINLTDITYLLKLEKGFFKGLTGKVGAGFSFSKSSSLGQLTINSTVNYVQKRFEHQLTASELASIDSSKFSRDNENIQLFSNYNLNEVWFLSGLLNYQRNLELSLSRRFQEMIGGGGKLIVRNDLQLLLVSGITMNQEKSTEGIESGLLFEIPLMLRFNFYRFHHPDIQISSIQTAYYGLTEKGRVRFDSNTSFSLTIVRDLAVSLSFYTSYDNKPSSSSNSNFDYGSSFTFSYKF